MNYISKKNEKTLLLIIDVQNNFINKYTYPYVKKINDLINSQSYDYIVFTKFINTINSPFYQILHYQGCMETKDTDLCIKKADAKIIEKSAYTALTPELLSFTKEQNIKTIYLCGFDTNACILKTALDLFEINYKFKVLIDYCYSHSGRRYHKYGLKILTKLVGNENII